MKVELCVPIVCEKGVPECRSAGIFPMYRTIELPFAPYPGLILAVGGKDGDFDHFKIESANHYDVEGKVFYVRCEQWHASDDDNLSQLVADLTNLRFAPESLTPEMAPLP